MGVYTSWINCSTSTVGSWTAFYSISSSELETLLAKENKGRDYLRLLDLEDPQENIPPQRELRAYISSLAIEAYRQEEISRGRLIELSRLLKLPFQDLLNLADSDED